MKRNCKDCGKVFELSDSEIQFYKSKNLELPKRCSSCREKNRIRRENAASASAPQPKTPHEKAETDFTTGIPVTDKQRKSGVAKIVSAILAVFMLLGGWLFGPDFLGNFGSGGGGQPDSTVVYSEEDDPDSADDSEAIEESGGADTSAAAEDADSDLTLALTFRSHTLLMEHYEKHGIEMGFTSAEEYAAAANRVVTNPASLHKLEAEDGDDVYYLESTNEFVIVSTDGYLRTYFCPNSGISYYNRQ